MLKMVLYQYLIGSHSPTAWKNKARDHDEMKWLGRGYVPSRMSWYNFRDRASKFIEQVHTQIVQSAIDQGFLDPSVGIQDGTSMAACASRHRMINRETLDKRLDTLDAAINGTNAEDLPKWVPPTESGRQEVRNRMEKASEILNSRIEANAKKPADRRKKPSKIVVSTSDPDAPLGRDKMKVYRPLYTAQFVVAPFSYFIMSYGCDAAATDAGTLAPMIDKTQAIVGNRMKTMMVDGGYTSIIDLRASLNRNIDLLGPVQSSSLTASRKKSDASPKIQREDFKWDAENKCYTCPAGKSLNYLDRGRKQRQGDQFLWESRFRSNPEDCHGCPLLAQCLKNGATTKTIKRLEGQELLDEQRQKMANPEVQKRYKLRGQTVELAIADTKGNRRMSQFHGRGLSRVRAETGLLVVAINLLRLDKKQANALKPSATTT